MALPLPDIELVARRAGYWLLLPALITTLGFLPDAIVNQSALLLLYLMTVLIAALRTELSIVIMTGVISLLAFSFFHTDPVFSLLIRDMDVLVSSLLFVAFAIVAGGISHELKSQLRHLEQQGRFLRAQVSLGKQLQKVTTEEDVLPLLNTITRTVLQRPLQFRLLPPNTGDNPGNSWYLTWTVPEKDKPYGDEYTMVINIKEQAQGVLERLAMNRELQVVERQSDEERLRSALLSSVSHDLKGPLTSMMNTASHLNSQSLDNQQRQSLIALLMDEAKQLESYIQNLLDMTRIGHGQLSLSRERVEIDTLYSAVSQRLFQRWPKARIDCDFQDELPVLYVHGALIEHALFNALDNAIKAEQCSDKQSEGVLLNIRKRRELIEMRICDHGPGLPEDEWEAAFTQYYTCSNHGEYQKGTGLGLSICRSIFRVHGGDAVIVSPPPGYGHCLLLTLPLSESPD